jgi:hypothetical protein
MAYKHFPEPILTPESPGYDLLESGKKARIVGLLNSGDRRLGQDYPLCGGSHNDVPYWELPPLDGAAGKSTIHP